MRGRRFISGRTDDIAAARRVGEAARKTEQEGPPLPPELARERAIAEGFPVYDPTAVDA